MRCGVALCICTAIACAQQPDTLVNYNAAFYTLGNNSYGDHARQEVFPRDGKPFAIPLPFPCQTYYYGPDGEALYCSSMDGVLKIGLHPVRTKLISGSQTLRIRDLATSALRCTV